MNKYTIFLNAQLVQRILPATVCVVKYHTPYLVQGCFRDSDKRAICARDSSVNIPCSPANLTLHSSLQWGKCPGVMFLLAASHLLSAPAILLSFLLSHITSSHFCTNVLISLSLYFLFGALRVHSQPATNCISAYTKWLQRLALISGNVPNRATACQADPFYSAQSLTSPVIRYGSK